MTQLIHLLPSDVINQIAAGEVVERPASVIKELIENSLDSGATQIEILLRSGGLDEIRVIDNGSGITPLDLPLAVQRHATSKLRLASDLTSIGTFGFRGEALSSICSVAQVTLISRTKNSSTGHQMILNEGVVQNGLQIVAAPQGTQIIVSSLFMNTPARRKFLRSSHTELSHCQKMVKEIALGNPGIRFTLRNDNRILATYLSSTRKDRFRECLKLPQTPLEFKEHREEMSLEVYLSPPEHSVARSELYLFINGRPVRHRPFLSAIRTAFLEAWGPENEPIGACYLDLRRDWVDVNVHPQKWEVRCFQQESIYYWLLSSLRKQMTPAQAKAVPSPVSAPRDFPMPSYRPIHAPAFSSPPSRPFNFLFKNERFLVCEDKEGLIVAQQGNLIIDVEMNRLLKLKKQGLWPVEVIEIPRICRLSEQLRPVAERHQGLLKDWGFQNDNFGDGDFSIRTRPSFVAETLVDKVFSDFVSCLLDEVFIDEIKLNPEKLVARLLKISHASQTAQLSPSLDSLLDELGRQMEQKTGSCWINLHRIPYKEVT